MRPLRRDPSLQSASPTAPLEHKGSLHVGRTRPLRRGNLSVSGFAAASSTPLSVANGDISPRRGESSPFRGAKGDVLASEAPLKGELAAAG